VLLGLVLGEYFDYVLHDLVQRPNILGFIYPPARTGGFSLANRRFTCARAEARRLPFRSIFWLVIRIESDSRWSNLRTDRARA
jgi:hypothetical protein